VKIHHFIRTLGLARRNFFANRKRNLFSILTVILGSLAIGAVFTVNNNVDVHIDQLIARSGGPNIYVNLRQPPLIFQEADITALKSLASVRYVTVDSQIAVNARNRGEAEGLVVNYVGEDYQKARPIEVVAGQFISSWDLNSPSNNIVLSSEAATKLKLPNPIGETITINVDERNVLVNIIGIANPLYDSDRGMAWISDNLYRQISRPGFQSSLIVGFSSYDHLDFLESNVTELLGPKFKNNFEIYNPRRNFESIRNDYQIFIKAGAIVGILALMAGSVGVMNMMLIGIQLRTKEIGLYRALGFPTAVVLVAFLCEALMILLSGGLVGAVLGSIFGIGISAQIVATQPFFSASAFFLALASSFTVGLFFAYIPAKRASEMDTIEALKT
jgi:putative ABC transport system permease protein